VCDPTEKSARRRHFRPPAPGPIPQTAVPGEDAPPHAGPPHRPNSQHHRPQASAWPMHPAPELRASPAAWAHRSARLEHSAHSVLPMRSAPAAQQWRTRMQGRRLRSEKEQRRRGKGSASSQCAAGNKNVNERGKSPMPLTRRDGFSATTVYTAENSIRRLFAAFPESTPRPAQSLSSESATACPLASSTGAFPSRTTSRVAIPASRAASAPAVIARNEPKTARDRPGKRPSRRPAARSAPGARCESRSTLLRLGSSKSRSEPNTRSHADGLNSARAGGAAFVSPALQRGEANSKPDQVRRDRGGSNGLQAAAFPCAADSSRHVIRRVHGRASSTNHPTCESK
jgi:hypothetical protein